MTEDTALRRKTIKIEGHDVLLTEPMGLAPVMAEVVTEVRTMVDGNFAVSLGAFVHDDGSGPEVRITARLRITAGALAVIANAIQSQREQIAKAKETAN